VKGSLAVTGIGMLSPVGLTGLIALHSIRSGVSRLTLQPFPDRVREWIVGSSIPKWVPLVTDERLAALAFDAISAALERADVPLTDADALGATALILGCPETGRPGYQFPPAEKGRAADWTRQTVLEAFGTVDVVAGGSCSAQFSLGRAADLLAKPSIRRCVVGAVDTQLQLRTIRWHEANSRLKCSYVTDGLIPAEAACFVVVESEATARARGAKILARIASVNVAREAATILSDRPNTAAALTKVVRATLAEAGVRSGDVGMVWSDLNGESYRAREWAFTEVRLGFTASTELMHPADCHGDIGAATDANLLGLAALCHGTGWSDGKPLLVISGSEGGLRAATLLMPGDDGAGFLLQVSRRLPRAFTTNFRVPPPPVPPDDFRRSEDPPRSYFEWQLQEEHRDALASLHYQRNTILRDETIPWPRLREPEQRMLTHLDAAVASGPTSMAVVAAAVRADEEGLAFAGSLLLGTLPNQDNFSLIVAACEQAAAPQLAGIAAGLTHAAPSEALDGFIAHSIESSNPTLQAMAISVAAKRHLNIGPMVARLGEVADASLAKAIADAAWCMRMDDVGGALQRLLSHQRPDVRQSAMLALLRLVPDRAAAFARSRLDLNTEFGGALATCIGVAGDISDAHLLLAVLERNPADLATVTALGILGAPDSVPQLIGLLHSGSEDMKLAVASALDLVSGLRARERVMRVSDPETSAEESTVEAREVEQCVTSPEYWTNWWHGQRSRLQTNVRWRRGGYFTLNSCIAELADARSTLTSRRRAYMELTTLAPVRIPFEPDWFVARQEHAIEAWKSWLESSNATR